MLQSYLDSYLDSSKIPEKVFQNICTYSFDSLQELDSNYQDEFLYLLTRIKLKEPEVPVNKDAHIVVIMITHDNKE